MISLENSIYQDLILKKLEFDFGNVYLMDDIVVSELHDGIVAGPDHALLVLKETLAYYDEFNVIKKRIWIANKTERYSVKLVGWLHLKKLAQDYLLGYCVVDNSPTGMLQSLLESKFVPINFKAAKDLDEAMEWSNSLYLV
jgi:hypothetical protein